MENIKRSSLLIKYKLLLNMEIFVGWHFQINLLIRMCLFGLIKQGGGDCESEHLGFLQSKNSNSLDNIFKAYSEI